uniref:GRB2-associated-binding protein 3-like n=1 Tax=Dermatophagoides pteronyssinus TaxID=6956 RepID=A0A6P6YK94_DERPT|nr:GRB2-associated-binding protein 3-like [Dermatophagoides pteronyssinus]
MFFRCSVLKSKMDMLNNQQIVHAGWLIKSPPEKRIWKTKWRRRWFVLKPSGQIPGQYVLEYYTDSTCKKLKGQIDLDQCEQVDAGLQLEIRKQNYDNMFDLRTSRRTYYLVAGCEDEMNKWVECICSVCGLKMESIQNDLTLLPTIDMNINGSQNSSTNNSPNHNHHQNNLNSNEELRYSPQPSQNDQQQQQQQQLTSLISTQQQQQSTSESSLSTLNYIPISECYSGKSIYSHNNNDRHNLNSSSPPPRPPKPPTLQQQNINQLFPSVSKSQSSLALWPQDQQQQPSIPKTTAAAAAAIGKVQLSSSSLHQMTTNGSGLLQQQQPPPLPKSLTTTALLNNRSFYLNSSNKQQQQKQSDNNQFYNVYDTWHSRSTKRQDFLLASLTPPPPPPQSSSSSSQNQLIPPQVNRDLKPNRRNQQRSHPGILSEHHQNQKQTKSDSNVVMEMILADTINNNKQQPFKRINQNNSQPIMASRHTLPRPLITSYTLRNQNKNNDNYCHLAHCEQPKTTTIEDCERQYLDLDLDVESSNNSTTNNNSNSPKTANDNGGLVSSSSSSSTTITDHGHLSSNHSNHHHHQQQQCNIPDNQSSDLLLNNNNNICDQISLNIGHNSTMTMDFADNPGTVYKEVDFLKTKALNEMRLNMNIYRKAN